MSIPPAYVSVRGVWYRTSINIFLFRISSHTRVCQRSKDGRARADKNEAIILGAEVFCSAAVSTTNVHDSAVHSPPPPSLDLNTLRIIHTGTADW